MDLVKTPSWKEIIESLANELGTQIKAGGTIYGTTPRFQELRRYEEDSYAPMKGVYYFAQTAEQIPIVAGPFRTDEQGDFSQEMSEARKHLPAWKGHFPQMIKMSLKHAAIASQQLMSRRKTPDRERLMFTYWKGLRQANNIEMAIDETIRFLINQFKLGNATISLSDNRKEHFALNPTLRQAERRVIAQITDTKTPCVINTQRDFLLHDINDKENMPLCITAFPLIYSREIIGYVMLYGDEAPDVDSIKDLLQEFIFSLKRLSEYERVQESAVTDPLTGLNNRALLSQQMDNLLSELSKHKEPLSLLMIDADNFKNYNDTKGHPEGDKVLRTISHIIKSQIPEMALACRYGGEEFLIALPRFDQNQAKTFAEIIRKTIEQECPLTVSIGVVTCMNSSGSRESLIKLADDALYRAKHLGKNKVRSKIMLDKYLSVIDG